jgi:transposase-like protein
MNNTKICPACGSENIYETKKTINIKEPFAGEINFEIIENVCKTCDSKGDFFNQNDEIIEEKIKELKQRSVENILKHFIENKRSLTSIERALEIPFRTLAKWKNKITKTSAAGIVLLRFIRLFPWLLDVAENKYDPQKAENIMVENSMRLLQKTINTKTYLNTQEGEGTDLNIANFPNSLMTTNSFEHMHITQEDFEKDTEEVISMCLSSQEKI